MKSCIMYQKTWHKDKIQAYEMRLNLGPQN